MNLRTYKGSQMILMPFLFLLLKNNVSHLVGSGVNIILRSTCVNKDNQRNLTNHTLHHLELFAQFSGEFLLAVMKLHILGGCFPQPTDKVRLNNGNP